MSPSSPRQPPSEPVATAGARLRVLCGLRIRDERARRHWTLRDLATRARLSVAGVQAVESGVAGSIEAYVRLSHALGLRLEIDLVDPRKRHSETTKQADPVHAAMGELEAGHFRPMGFRVALDEPYQHYQFAGRADFLAWDGDARALLHIENRTRFPDFQEMAGAFNAKRVYLGQVLAERLNIGNWRSETHVIVALWSAEVLHSLRMHRDSFRALCADAPDGFAGWWRGEPPTSGRRSELVLLDPVVSGRQRQWLDLEAALTARPRHRGYAEVARLLARAA